MYNFSDNPLPNYKVNYLVLFKNIKNKNSYLNVRSVNVALAVVNFRS